MRLPDHIYYAVKQPFAHHGQMHIARLPQRADLRGPGTAFPTLKGINEVGSGEQFMTFHRDMVRSFKWIVEHTPGTEFNYIPWSEIPDWLIAIFERKSPGYLKLAFQEIDRLIQTGTLEQLGGFLEANLLNNHPQRNFHNYVHREVADYEGQKLGQSHPGLVDASMRSLVTAPYNEHFWGFHGWLDEQYARWQIAHGQAVDQSPLPPEQGLHTHTNHVTDHCHTSHA